MTCENAAGRPAKNGPAIQFVIYVQVCSQYHRWSRAAQRAERLRMAAPRSVVATVNMASPDEQHPVVLNISSPELAPPKLIRSEEKK